jgi:AraC-like DNA-binding protein
MPTRDITSQRLRKPQFEHELARNPALGYEAPEDAGFIRCLDHGFPTPLARWHYHDEYELHLIVATSGKAFVGDYIGYFQPGHLVLTGPKLPHNWISLDLPDGGVAERDLVIQFLHEPILEASQHISELKEILPLLERAKYGIEFFDISEQAISHWHHVKSQKGLARFAAFCEFLSDLAHCTEYRLLSHVPMQAMDNDAELDHINAITSRITQNLVAPLTAADLAVELGMTESKFSRFFRRATGNTFTDFVTRVRINRACQLLMETDQYIAQIGYEVGFNNIANFNRRFQDVKGTTPSEFRRQVEVRFGNKTALALTATVTQ